MDQHLLTQNMFSFYMTTSQNDSSELIFGGYDREKFTGNIQWHDCREPKAFYAL
jgi:hypothetical protein